MKTFAKCLLTVSLGAVMGCSPVKVVTAPAHPLRPVAAIPLEISQPQSSKEAIDTERREIAVQVLAPSTYLVAIAPNVYELRDSPTSSKYQVAEPVATDADKASRGEAVRALASGNNACALLQGVKIEISNGAGIRLLARRTAMRLESSGVLTARLTNQRRFDQARTEIQFSAGQEDAASILATLLPATVKMVPENRLTRNIQIRLVLGRDFSAEKTALWLNSEGLDADHRAALVARSMPPEFLAICKV
jgi:hypothetical protein